MSVTFVKRSVVLAVMISSCLAVPIMVTTDHDTPFSGTVADDHENKRNGPFGHNIGSAVAPVVGAVVGPLLVNIANGITNGITSTITSGYEHLHFGESSLPFGPYNVYLVDFDDDSRPYILLDSIKDHGKPEYYGAASSYNYPSSEHRLTNAKEQYDSKSTLPDIVPLE